MKALVVIPARGGSKGIPRKNIKKLNGKPLIQYTIDAAKAILPLENIYVSTDDFEIKQIVETLGVVVPFLRPQELATDSAGTHEVLLHALKHYEIKGFEADTLILLQATSPFRTAEHIKQAIELFNNNEGCEMVVSVKETSSNPYYVHFEQSKEGYLKKLLEPKFLTRQDCPTVYELNGAIYIIKTEVLKEKKMNEFTKIIKYQMDDASSHDIDTMFDWQFAEFIVNQQK